jgi:hypothetical protein
MKVGDRVEIKAVPWRGRVGTLERRRRILGVLLVWDVRCDVPDGLGRTLVSVSSRGVRPVRTKEVSYGV